jgi:hypothetical protein
VTFVRHARTCILLALLLVSSAAFAGDTPEKPEAKAYFSDGTAAFERGEYAAASRAFAAGYEIENWNGFLFAWAQAERKAKNCAKAIQLYSRFIATKPADSAKEHALGWIKVCGGEYVEPPPEPVKDPRSSNQPNGDLNQPNGDPIQPNNRNQPRDPNQPKNPNQLKDPTLPDGAPGTPRTPESPGFPHKLAIGLGVAAIASSSVAIWQYRRARRDFDSADAAIDYDDVALRRERGEDRLLVARIAGGIGIGFAAAAVLRFVLHDTSPNTEVLPAGNGVAIRRRF